MEPCLNVWIGGGCGSTGPGQYSVLQPSGGPAFTMAGRLTERSAPAEGLPGPGDYEQPQSALLGGGPAFSFTGRGGEQELRPPSPGPGEWVGGIQRCWVVAPPSVSRAGAGVWGYGEGNAGPSAKWNGRGLMVGRGGGEARGAEPAAEANGGLGH